MKISDKGLALMEILEGKKNFIYLDQAGWPTIGVGHLLLAGEKEEFKNGITDEKVKELLDRDMDEAERIVNKYVKVEITQAQFDALVIFSFNIGDTGFIFSTALKLINAKREMPEIEKWWKAWNKITVEGVKQVSSGLVNRREAEWKLYSQGLYS